MVVQCPTTMKRKTILNKIASVAGTKTIQRETAKGGTWYQMCIVSEKEYLFGIPTVDRAGYGLNDGTKNSCLHGQLS